MSLPKGCKDCNHNNNGWCDDLKTNKESGKLIMCDKAYGLKSNGMIKANDKEVGSKYIVGDIVCDYMVYMNDSDVYEPTRTILNSKSNAELIATIMNKDLKHKSIVNELKKRIDTEIEFAKSCNQYLMVAGMQQLKKVIYEVLEIKED